MIEALIAKGIGGINPEDKSRAGIPPFNQTLKSGGVNVGGFTVGAYESDAIKIAKYAAMGIVALFLLKKLLK